MLNLSRAVQFCVGIGVHPISGMIVPPPDMMGQTFDILAQAEVLNRGMARSLKKAVGFGNIAVHNSDYIDWYIVHSVVKNHLANFRHLQK